MRNLVDQETCFERAVHSNLRLSQQDPRNVHISKNIEFYVGGAGGGASGATLRRRIIEEPFRLGAQIADVLRRRPSLYLAARGAHCA